MSLDERQGELQSLKQQVADLWLEFRKKESAPDPRDADAHRALAERYRTLEAHRRKLLDRRAMLRHELEVLELRTSRIAPVMRFFGGIAGVLVSLAVVMPLLDTVATQSLLLEPAHGAALLTLSLAVLAVAVAGD